MKMFGFLWRKAAEGKERRDEESAAFLITLVV